MKRVILGLNHVVEPCRTSQESEQGFGHCSLAAHFLEAGSNTLHLGEVYGNPKKDADV